MKRPGTLRIAGGLAGLALLLTLAVASAAAHEHVDCELRVEPRSAVAGSIFVLSGTGYSPTELILQADGGAPARIELARSEGDPFEIPISSQPGDEGRWTATVSDPDAECTASVRFRVTLLDTAMADGRHGQATMGAGGLPAVMYLLVILAGFAGGTLLARQARAG